MSTQRSVLGLKVLLWLGALAPGAWLVIGFFRDDLTANPIEKITHVTGLTALVLLIVTLAVTPIRRYSGWNPIAKLRRPLGLFAFFYAFVHFGIWAGLDMTFVWEWMLEDIAERPYITVGFSAFIVLVPLALTSTQGAIRRLGKRWGILHRGAYLAAALGVVHFYWLVKADTRLPLSLGAALVVLLALRVPAWREKRARRAARAAASSEPSESATAV